MAMAQESDKTQGWLLGGKFLSAIAAILTGVVAYQAYRINERMVENQEANARIERSLLIGGQIVAGEEMRYLIRIASAVDIKLNAGEYTEEFHNTVVSERISNEREQTLISALILHDQLKGAATCLGLNATSKTRSSALCDEDTMFMVLGENVLNVYFTLRQIFDCEEIESEYYRSLLTVTHPVVMENAGEKALSCEGYTRMFEIEPTTDL